MSFAQWFHFGARLNTVSAVDIHTDGLSYAFPDGSVGLKPTTVDFSASDGHVAIIGLNGAGKSTLLQLLAGLMEPTQGMVRYTDADGDEWTSRSASGRKRLNNICGYIERDEIPAIFNEELSIREAFDALLRHHHMHNPEREATREHLFAHFDLTQVAHMPVTALDTEQLHMLSIAIACAHNPAALIADEPTRGLDEISSGHVARALLSYDKPIMFATHDVDMVTCPDYHVTRTLVMDDQSVVFDGTPREAAQFYSDLIRGKYKRMTMGAAPVTLS